MPGSPKTRPASPPWSFARPGTFVCFMCLLSICLSAPRFRRFAKKICGDVSRQLYFASSIFLLSSVFTCCRWRAHRQQKMWGNRICKWWQKMWVSIDQLRCFCLIKQITATYSRWLFKVGVVFLPKWVKRVQQPDSNKPFHKDILVCMFYASSCCAVNP